MEVVYKNSVGEEIRSHWCLLGTITIILIVISNLYIAIECYASPIIIDGDSNGSWSDSFEDETGIEESYNITVENGEVKLGPNGTVDPLNWTKHGMVLDIGSGGDYDSIDANHPFVIKDAGIYKMWYSGWDGSNSRIMYATSSNGITWIKQGLVLDIGNPGELDDSWVAIPQVIYDIAEYKMWYTGNDGSTERIFYAKSTDGVDWNKQGLVFDVGTPGQLDDEGVRPYHVIKENNEYKMWYGGFDGSNRRLLYANSSDGISWTRQGLAINLGNPGDYDDMHIGGVVVINDTGLFRMWYSGHDDSIYRILYAYSNDGINWIKQGLALNTGSPGELDDFQVVHPMVIKDSNDIYKMWYQGTDGSNTRIFYATSYYLAEEGNLTSKRIFLPQGQTWNTLNLSKEESGVGNYINISILDGETNETILGFENMTVMNIDISSIDYNTPPTIRLFAKFDGYNQETPVLHDWTVTWSDTIPPQTPNGLTINNPFTGYSLILSWNSNLETDMRTYILYYSTDNSTFNWLTNISVNTISFIHYGLDQGTTYFYKIAAADEVPNQSNFSYVVEGTPVLDYDGDGIGNIDDPDDDNDGIPDISDPYPLNPLNDMEATIDIVNETLNDIQSRIIDIQLDLDNLNISIGDLKNTLYFLNQTVPIKIDDIRNKLDNMNLNDSALKIWLEVVLEAIDTNLTTTSETLQNQLDDLDTTMTSFYNTLRTDIGDILSALQLHDDTTGENHSDIIILLQDLLNGQIEEEKIDDLKIKLINLAQNLSSHNQSIANDILDVVNDIDTFETETQQKLDNINATLNDLAKLDAIINDLVALNQLLQSMEDDMQDSKSKVEEMDEKIILIELLMIIVLVLLVVNLIMILFGRKQKNFVENPKLKEGTEYKKDQENPPPPPPLQD